jgi:hypothetical protein
MRSEVVAVPVSYQPVIDCRSPETLALFWAEALHYVIAPPPPGDASWDAFLGSIGLPEEGLDHDAVAMRDPQCNEFDVNQGL